VLPTSQRFALFALVALSCKPRDPEALHVLAAASLADVLPEVAASFSDGNGGTKVEMIFDATSRLATQIEAGAPADVFISADAQWMDTLASKHLVLADTRHDLLGNRLVVVVPKDATDPPKDVNALRTTNRLALAGANVPAGKYARAALEHEGVLADVQASIVEGDSVRTALAWVAKGEADAAIVYATDARIEPAVEVAFELPASSHPPIVYPIAALAERDHEAAARRFVDHARSDASRAIFERAGFAPPP
jgi:molybdate transport system substrate-binding protein